MAIGGVRGGHGNDQDRVGAAPKLGRNGGTRVQQKGG